VRAATIRHDVEQPTHQKLKLYLSGLLKQIDKNITHKIWVVSLYLQWRSSSEIERNTGHTGGRIRTYCKDFCRVMVAQDRAIRLTREIGYYLQRTERLAGEYLTRLKEAETIPKQRLRVEILKYEMRHLERKSPGMKGFSTLVWRFLV
jgi:hypothetical protein